MTTVVFNNDAIFDFVNYVAENVKLDQRVSKRFAQSFHQMSANPDLFESATLLSYNNKNEYCTIDKNIIWANPNDHAVNLAYTLCHKPQKLVGQDVDWSSIPNYFWIGNNHHPTAVQDICRRYDSGNRYSKNKTKMLWWGELCFNQHPVVVDIVDEIIEKKGSRHFIYDISKHNLGPNCVHLGRLAANPSATNMFLEHGWFERSLDSRNRDLLWKAFSTNPDPKAIRYMKENLDKVDFSWLSHNPNSRAIEMLKERPDEIDWKWLSTNPAAIKMIKANPRKIHVGMMCIMGFIENVTFDILFFENIAMHSPEERQICCRLRAQGLPLTVIATALNVCKRTVQRWLNNKPMVSRPLNRSHLRKLNETQRAQVSNFFLSNNTNRIRDGIKFVANAFGIYVSLSTIQRVLHESRLTYKKASTAYKEADLVRQKEFLSTLSQHANKSWIALDEAAFFLNHSRKYAWSEKGKPAVVRKPGARGKMHSLILATSPDGVIKWHLVQGSINSQRFHSFLSELPNDTNVLLDNVSTHKATHSLRKQDLSTIPEVADSKHLNMLYLPPYSPQLNPVELCFNFIRTSVNGSAPRTLESLRSSIQTAVKALTPSVCRSMFARTLKIC